jgi:hypothetical protein
LVQGDCAALGNAARMTLFRLLSSARRNEDGWRSSSTYAEFVLSVACGKTPKSAVAEFLRENVAPA